MNSEQRYFYGNIPIIYDMTEEKKAEILEKYPLPDLPEGEEGFTLDYEEKGNTVQIRALLNEAEIHTTRTNNQYLKMTFSNNAGTFQAKMWDNDGAVQKNFPLLESHSVFDMVATVDEFRGFKSLTIHQLSPCEEEINPFYYLPYTKQNLEDFTMELFAYLDELTTPYRELAFAIMDRFWGQFATSPAAKGFHHNYLGGLLKHTVGLMRFARYIVKMENDPFQAVMKLIQIVEKAHKRELWASFTNDETNAKFVWRDTIDHLYRMLSGMMEHRESEPNYDVLMTSILLHDIGKILEYDHAGKKFDAFEYLYPSADTSELENRKQKGITMDELGVMIGHIPYGVLLFTRALAEVGVELTLQEIHAVSHCILCHHGLPEWGSSIGKPQTIEGYIIHIVDYLDSRYENSETVK